MSQHTDFAKSHMDKCIEALKANFARVRSGRANPHICLLYTSDAADE